MLSLDLARSVHEERVHEIEAETSWRAIRRQLDAAQGRNVRRQGLLRRLAGFLASAADRSRWSGQDAGAGAATGS